MGDYDYYLNYFSCRDNALRHSEHENSPCFIKKSTSASTEDGYISVLDFSGKKLKGFIPEFIGYVLHAKIIRLSKNDFFGPIPRFLNGLTSLTELDLSVNNLSGPIPSCIGDLKNIRTINFSGNVLDGPIPPFIGFLSELRFLDLSFNKLSGSIPATIVQLKNLCVMNLQCNSLCGCIPPTIGQMCSLTRINMQNNAISGVIPSSLGLLRNLESLELQENQLSGEIPTCLYSISTLRVLSLRKNNLSGSIHEAGNQKMNHQLQIFDVEDNKLTGVFPIGMFSNAKQLKFLNVRNNQLSGFIPDVSNVGLCDYLSMYVDISLNYMYYNGTYMTHWKTYPQKIRKRSSEKYNEGCNVFENKDKDSSSDIPDSKNSNQLYDDISHPLDCTTPTDHDTTPTDHDTTHWIKFSIGYIKITNIKLRKISFEYESVCDNSSRTVSFHAFANLLRKLVRIKSIPMYEGLNSGFDWCDEELYQACLRIYEIIHKPTHDPLNLAEFIQAYIESEKVYGPFT